VPGLREARLAQGQVLPSLRGRSAIQGQILNRRSNHDA
jgi:hypothetical protein